jgi:hypothetical protein
MNPAAAMPSRSAATDYAIDPRQAAYYRCDFEARRSRPSHSNKKGHLALLAFLAKLELYRRALSVRRDQALRRRPLNHSASNAPIRKLLDGYLNSAADLRARPTQHNGSVKVGFHFERRPPSQDRLVSGAGLGRGSFGGAVLPPAKRADGRVLPDMTDETASRYLTSLRTAPMRAAP